MQGGKVREVFFKWRREGRKCRVFKKMKKTNKQEELATWEFIYKSQTSVLIRGRTGVSTRVRHGFRAFLHLLLLRIKNRKWETWRGIITECSSFSLELVSTSPLKGWREKVEGKDREVAGYKCKGIHKRKQLQWDNITPSSYINLKSQNNAKQNLHRRKGDGHGLNAAYNTNTG